MRRQGGSRSDYDLAVIGGGAAGLTAAAIAGMLGAKTALIERAEFGGECTWSGCVPSKALLKSAHTAQAAPDFAAVMARVRRVRAHVYEHEDAPLRIARYGVETFHAAARFLDRHTVELDGEGPVRLSARWFVIATGSRPRRLAVAAPAYDNETIWNLEKLPGRMLVAGGGPVAIEIAQAFRRLGSEVTVVTGESRILTRDDAECAAILHRQLVDDGISFAFDRTIISAQSNGGAISITLSNHETVEADLLFSAIGREARLDGLCLEKAGVEVRDGRIRVDARCRTTASNIYASGDVATEARFTHVAERMSTVAVTNAILMIPAKFDESELTWATFTEPELAQVGPTESRLRSLGRYHTVLRFPFERLDRAVADGACNGLVKILTSGRGRVLGASIVGARAGELIAELALAKKHRINVAALSETLHAYPTYAMATRRAADEFVLRKRTDVAVRVLRVVRRLRGTAPPLDAIL